MSVSKPVKTINAFSALDGSLRLPPPPRSFRVPAPGAYENAPSRVPYEISDRREHRGIDFFSPSPFLRSGPGEREI